MANVGYATLTVIPSAKGFGAALSKETGTAIGPAGKKAGAGFGKAFKGAAILGVAGVAAGIAVAAKGIGAAIDFDTQMREVFTLMPGITGEAMDAMSEDVKGFSTKFGVLPDEVVPALYQSLSAGVPQGNVFDFLETAQQAAKGGVTDLTTAVDGISSVVNAYGSDVIGAGEASDKMFTAVKLGKTTFEELSGSLFNVTPIASGLGIEFGEVTAGLAAMTAKGVPTKVASTQLRQLFIELSKEGGKASETFEKMAGKSFTEFVASGGDVNQALDIMKGAADDTGVGIQDLFGSVEAGAAALTLQGNEKFTEAMDEMANSTGATEAAFNTMEEGFQPVIDKLKAVGQVALINIGEFLLPIIEKVVAFVEENWPTIKKVFNQVKDAIVKAAKKAGEVLWDLGEAVVGVFQWLLDNKPALIGALSAIGIGAGIAFGIWAVGAAQAAIATLAATWPIIAIAVAIGLLVAGVIWAYQNWDWFREAVDKVAKFMTDTLWPALQTVFAYLQEKVPPIIAAVVRFFRRLWKFISENIIPILMKMWNFIKNKVIPLYIRFYTIVIKALIKAFQKIWNFINDKLIPIFKDMWKKFGEVKDKISGYIETIVGFFTKLPGRVKRAFGAGWNFIKTTFRTIKQWLSDRIDDIVTFFTELPERLKTAGSGMWSFIGDSFKTAINFVIRKWNNLSFTMPSATFLGQTIGGWTLDTKSVQIPELASGGVINSPTLALIGESSASNPEIVTPEALMRKIFREEMNGGGGAQFGDVIINDTTDLDGFARALNFQMGAGHAA